MKIINRDFKKGVVKVKITNLDDLWYLSNIIEPGDLIRGKTIRKIKINKEGDRKTAISKRSIFLEIKVEKIEFHKYSNILRVSGKITKGPDDVSLASYHTFNLDENTVIGLKKDNFLKYQIDRLKEASSLKQSKILICVLDREEVYFALSKQFGYQLLTSFEGEVQKKEMKTQIRNPFYSEIIKLLEKYNEQYNPNNIVVASPAFFKEDLIKQLKNQELKKKIVLATCSSVKENAINEVLKRPEVQLVLKKDRVTKEVNLVEELFKQIAVNGKSAYGLKQIRNVADAGAVEKLLITDTLIQKSRQQNTYAQIDYIMRLVDQMKGHIFIISSDHEAGKKLDGLGGVGAVLRYKLNY